MTPPPASSPSPLPEILFRAATRGAGLFILTLVATMLVVLFLDAYPALKDAGSYRMFSSSSWIPKPADDGLPTFGSLALIWGTVVTSVIAMVIAVPLGVASAAYLSEVAHGPVKKAGAFLIELLAAIPSVVYGFWGLYFLAPLVQKGFDAVGGPNTGGNGILSAGLILAIMVLPYITAISFDVCQAVPRSQREGALAVGASQWQTIWLVVLPYARPGIFAASFLALGRALGETMAVTMLIGNQAVIDLSPFATGNSIASKIANSLNEADDPTVRSALIGLSLILFAVTAAFNVSARLLLRRLTQGPKPRPFVASVSFSDELAETPTEPPSVPVRSHAKFWNRTMLGVITGCFVATVIPLFLILGYISVRGATALQPSLFTMNARPNIPDDKLDEYKEALANGQPVPQDEIGRPLRRGGLGHAMLGSAMIVGIATVLAVPFGLLAAIYLAEARNSKLANTVRFVTELLGGVPSIVIGIFAYAVLVVPTYSYLRGVDTPLGYSAWAGAFALAVMMIPIVVRSAEESMRLVPEPLRHASYALGANRMQTTLRIVIPASLPAIVTGIFLAIGRIGGETAPLLLTAFGTDGWPSSPAKPTAFLPGYIYKYSTSPYRDWQEQAWGGALVLLAVVMLVNVGIRLLAGKRMVAAARSD